MPTVFINYRHGNDFPYAKGIHDRLKHEFGADDVFMDVASLTPGVNFVERIDAQVRGAWALIVVIGPGWPDLRDDDGRRRLDEAEDFVRREIVAALENGVAVFPVLVGGASMPKARDLPEAMGRLAQLHALSLIHERWDHDMDDLAEAVRSVRPVVTLPGVRSRPPLVVTAQARTSERTVLHSLFGKMRDKRALLDYYQRADQAPVTDSIRDLRKMLIEAGDQLGPDSAAGPRLRLISDAIHDYLTAVEAADPDVLFAPALRDLRNAVRDVVGELGEAYDLEVARELVARMDESDAEVSPETRRLYADPHHREVTFEHG